MSLKSDLLLLAFRTAYYTAAHQPRRDSSEFEQLDFQVDELVRAIETLIDEKIDEALAQLHAEGYLST